MRAKRIGAAAVVALSLVSMLSVGNPARATVMCADASKQGCWSVPFSPFGKYDAQPPKTVEQSMEYPAAVSMAMMPTGRLVYWNGLTGLEDSAGPLPLDVGRSAKLDNAMILDLQDPAGTPAFYTPTNATGGGTHGMFCADQRLLANGQVIVAGGTDWKTDVSIQPVTGPAGPSGLSELYGSDQTRLYSDSGAPCADEAACAAAGFEYDPARNMQFRRWYPAMVTLPDGKIAVFGGVEKLLWNTKAGVLWPARDQQPRNVPEVEVYDPKTERWTKQHHMANRSLPLFARMFLLPSGEVLYTGVGQMWGPTGEDAGNYDDLNDFSTGEVGWNWRATYQPTAQSWIQQDDMGLVGARSGAVTVALPLRPPYKKAQFLVAGGTIGVSPSTLVATKLTEIITAQDTNFDKYWETTSRQASDLNNPRWFSSGVVLPNGDVVAVSGADKDEVHVPGFEVPVRQAEVWDANLEKWFPLKTSGRDRTYHNSAILLPDGSVLVGGHAPINQGYGPKGVTNEGTPFANNLKDPSFERLYPPYLFKGERPNVTVSQAESEWGSTLSFITDGGADVEKVVLKSLPTTTHITTPDDRTVELPFTSAGDVHTAGIPENRAVLPPGYYYLFGLSKAGVPSVATIVRIADDANPFKASAPVTLGDQAIAR